MYIGFCTYNVIHFFICNISDYLPAIRKYNYPEVYEMTRTRNFYIKTHDNITLGLW